MNMPLKEKILNEIEKLKGKTILVEGKKDKAALMHFGIDNVVILRKGVFETCEDLSKITDVVVVLTDLDKEGKKLYILIRDNLEKQRTKVDNRFRRLLLKNTPLKHIEGLVSYFETL